jgi:UDP-N-acetylmuramyl pentapeptide synthase
LRGLVRAGDAVLFKGSRGVQVERALERVLV